MSCTGRKICVFIVLPIWWVWNVINLSDVIHMSMTTWKRKMTLQDFSKSNWWSMLCVQIVSAYSKSSTSHSTNKWFQPKQKEVEFTNTYYGRFTSGDSKTLFGQVPMESFTISFATQGKKVLDKKNVVRLKQSFNWLKNYLKTKTSNYL